MTQWTILKFYRPLLPNLLHAQSRILLSRKCNGSSRLLLVGCTNYLPTIWGTMLWSRLPRPRRETLLSLSLCPHQSRLRRYGLHLIPSLSALMMDLSDMAHWRSRSSSWSVGLRWGDGWTRPSWYVSQKSNQMCYCLSLTGRHSLPICAQDAMLHGSAPHLQTLHDHYPVNNNSHFPGK